MFYNDTISELDRCRVFNLYVVPALNELDNRSDAKKKIFADVTKDKSYILFTYKFSDDTFKYEGTLDFKELHDRFKKADEIGDNHFKNLTKTLNIKLNNKDNKLYICVFHYGPRESFHPSIYSFEKTIIDQWDDSLYFSPPPEESEYNQWFSNQMIKNLIDLEKLKTMKSQFDQLPRQTVPAFIWNISKDTNGKIYYVNIDNYIKACNKALVPTDMQKLIIDEHAKCNDTQRLFIVNIINYLRDYFLLIKIDQNQLTLISSPNDESLCT